MTAAQLAAFGLGRPGIAKRVQNGSLHRIHRGVYAVGHPRLAERGLWMAAVLAAGEGAALAGLSAAMLWRISRFTPNEIHVLAPGDHRRRAGFRLQTSRCIHPRELTRHVGIPVTTVARTLVDLTAVLTPHQLANVIHEAAFRKRFEPAAIQAAMARAKGRTRLCVLEEALALNAKGSAGTRSEPEDRFLEHVLDAGLPEPEVNVMLEGFEVDFLWRDRRLVVELDGPAHERARTQREDRERDERLKAAGHAVHRTPPERR